MPKHIAKVVGALLILLSVWAICIFILMSLPGTPHSKLASISHDMANNQPGAFERFFALGEEVEMWDALIFGLAGGLILGLSSKLWLRLTPSHVAIVLLFILLFRIKSYRPCCVTVWDFVFPVLLAAILLAFTWKRGARPAV